MESENQLEMLSVWSCRCKWLIIIIYLYLVIGANSHFQKKILLLYIFTSLWPKNETHQVCKRPGQRWHQETDKVREYGSRVQVTPDKNLLIQNGHCLYSLQNISPTPTHPPKFEIWKHFKNNLHIAITLQVHALPGLPDPSNPPDQPASRWRAASFASDWINMSSYWF